MTKEEKEIIERITLLSHDDLIRMTENPQDYTPFALDIAKNELEKRGGKADVISRAKAREVANILEGADKTQDDGLFKVTSFSKTEFSTLIIINIIGIVSAFQLISKNVDVGLMIFFSSLIALGSIDFLAWLTVRAKISFVKIATDSLIIGYRSGRKMALASPFSVRLDKYFGVSKPHTVRISGLNNKGKKVTVKLRRDNVDAFELFTHKLKSLQG